MTTTSDAKRITFNRETKDYDATFDGRYIGSFANHHQAEVALNDYALDLIEQGLVDDMQVLARPAEAVEVVEVPAADWGAYANGSIDTCACGQPAAQLLHGVAETDIPLCQQCWWAYENPEPPCAADDPPNDGQEPGGSGGGGGRVPADLRHPIYARVFVPSYDDFGEVVDICQNNDGLWYYTVRLDGPGTIYDLTDADVIGRPDDTSEPMPPLLISALPAAPPAVETIVNTPDTFSGLEASTTRSREGAALIGGFFQSCTICGGPHVPTRCPDVALAKYGMGVWEAYMEDRAAFLKLVQWAAAARLALMGDAVAFYLSHRWGHAITGYQVLASWQQNAAPAS